MYSEDIEFDKNEIVYYVGPETDEVWRARIINVVNGLVSLQFGDGSTGVVLPNDGRSYLAHTYEEAEQFVGERMLLVLLS